MSLIQNHAKLNTEQALLNSIKIYLPDLILTTNDLKNPTVSSVCNFYTAFLEELGGNTANVVQIQMNQMTLINHVDMFNATVPLFNLFYGVKHFLNCIGITDFSLSDIAEPSRERALIHFSALMHFLAYCDETISGLQSDLQEVSDMKDQCNELCHKIEILRSDINQKATERVKRREKSKEVEKIIELDKIDLNTHCIEKESLKQAMENVKKIGLQFEEKDTQLVRIIKNMEDENSRLQTMIVKSPEKLKMDLNQLIAKKEEFLKNVRDLKSQVEAKKKLTNDHTMEQENQQIRRETLKDLIQINERLNESKMEIDGLVKKCNKVIEREEDIKRKILNIQHKCKALQETRNDLKARQGKKESEKNILISVEEEYKALIQKRDGRYQYISYIKEKMRELIDDEDRINNDQQKYVSSFLEEHNEMSNMEERLYQKYTTQLVRFQKNNKLIHTNK